MKIEAENVYNVQTTLSGEFENLVVPKRVLIRQGYMEDALTGTKVYCFLFNDLMVVAKPIHIQNGEVKHVYSYSMPLSDAELSQKNNRLCLSYKSNDKKSSPVVVSTDNSEWAKDIQKIVNALRIM